MTTYTKTHVENCLNLVKSKLLIFDDWGVGKEDNVNLKVQCMLTLCLHSSKCVQRSCLLHISVVYSNRYFTFLVSFLLAHDKTWMIIRRLKPG